ncbi:MAG TPA: Uma2 family endonuclease [Gemmatimonadaceae bacterium]|nr:Uma2 family endonuclease [Gemmatimonadaceae bacterium]
MRYRRPPVPRIKVSTEEYLAFEAASAHRHEFVSGEICVMNGATVRHNLITLNIAQRLRNAARALRCRVVVADVKLRVGPDRVYYPDVMVACGQGQDGELVVEDPLLLVEVTSPSTQATDRREKLDAYQRLASLRLYMVVDQRRRFVVVYARDETGAWLRDEFQGAGDIPIPQFETIVTLDEIYDDVALPALSVDEGEEWEDDDWSEEEVEADWPD